MRYFIILNVSINVKCVRKLICDLCSLTYSVDFHGASNGVDNFIDVCLMFAAKEIVHSIYFLTIPTQDNRTGTCVHQIVIMFLEELLYTV